MGKQTEKGREARGQTARMRKKWEKYIHTSTRNHSKCDKKNIPREKEEIWVWNMFCENNLSVIYMLLFELLF